MALSPCLVKKPRLNWTLVWSLFTRALTFLLTSCLSSAWISKMLFVICVSMNEFVFVFHKGSFSSRSIEETWTFAMNILFLFICVCVGLQLESVENWAFPLALWCGDERDLTQSELLGDHCRLSRCLDRRSLLPNELTTLGFLLVFFYLTWLYLKGLSLKSQAFILAYRKEFPSRELARFGLALRFRSASVAHERHESSESIPCVSGWVCLATKQDLFGAFLFS